MTTRGAFSSELEQLKEDLLQMGALAELAIRKAVKALLDRDPELARGVVEADRVINSLELGIEKRCLDLLALQQPMAKDLRTIGTVLKIISDVERIADHARDIAKIVIRLGNEPLLKPLVDIVAMAEIAREMVRESLNAFVAGDVDGAHAMVRRDDELDRLYATIFRELTGLDLSDPGRLNQALHLLLVGQHLERIGDHATNIGEWVVYMITGERQELND